MRWDDMLYVGVVLPPLDTYKIIMRPILHISPYSISYTSLPIPPPPSPTPTPVSILLLPPHSCGGIATGCGLTYLLSIEVGDGAAVERGLATLWIWRHKTYTLAEDSLPYGDDMVREIVHPRSF